MSNLGIRGFVALAGLSATSLYAAQPPNQNAVLTDGFYNTAMGLGSLASDVTPKKQCVSIATGTSGFYMSGCGNTASGFFALHSDTTGAGNTADGAGALYANTTGQYNTAAGVNALLHSSTGSYNAALGADSLFSNTSGYDNVAAGFHALFSNTVGAYNVATGAYALYSNTNGIHNVALGYDALRANTVGQHNIAVGSLTLASNTTGYANGATGYGALQQNSAGHGNVANGFYALISNTIGSRNSGMGNYALRSNTTGSYNTAIGWSAGNALATGQYNTYVGYNVTGPAAENYTTRIGVADATATTYVAGIANTQLTGTPAQVYVTAGGQLGVLASSERYKTDIVPLGATSERLAALRPVSFHLKADPSGPVQYGLIAEEVERVYPELVIHDEKGVIQGVRYDELAPMLLNQVQQDHATIVAQAARLSELDDLKRQVTDLKAQAARVGDLERQLGELVAELKSRQEMVAQR